MEHERSVIDTRAGVDEHTWSGKGRGAKEGATAETIGRRAHDELSISVSIVRQPSSKQSCSRFCCHPRVFRCNQRHRPRINSLPGVLLMNSLPLSLPLPFACTLVDTEFKLRGKIVPSLCTGALWFVSENYANRTASKIRRRDILMNDERGDSDWRVDVIGIADVGEESERKSLWINLCEEYYYRKVTKKLYKNVSLV